MRARLWLVLVSIAALALVADAAGLRGRTLEATKVPVVALGLESGRLFWTLDACAGTYTRPAAEERPVLLRGSTRVECLYPDEAKVAFGSSRALWTAVDAGNFVYEDVMVGAPGERSKVLEQVIGETASPGGDYVTDAAGSGATLVYSVVTAGMLDTCIDPGTPCDYFIQSGRTMRVVGRRAVRVPGVPPVVRLAAGGGRIAVDVAGDHDGQRLVRAGRVEVRDAASGRLTATVKTTGNVLELALSGDVLAVLVRSGGREVIERYAPRGGRLLGRTPVYGNARALVVAGRSVVFLSGRTIRQVGAGIIAVAATPPVAVAVDGSRVVWAETAGKRGRIVLGSS